MHELIHPGPGITTVFYPMSVGLVHSLDLTHGSGIGETALIGVISASLGVDMDCSFNLFEC
jgi:hypothetical protein